MDLESIIISLESTARAIAAAVEGVDDETANWKPDEDTWSIVEIVNHLADEEDEDFRKRVSLTMQDPDLDWPPIDPQNAAVERRFNERTLRKSISRFGEERARSLAWLRAMSESPELDRKKTHPRGDLRVGDLLASWAAHDLLHLR